MKVIQCEHGHYYDADKYDVCPTCQKKLNINPEEKTEVRGKESIRIISNNIDVDTLDECKDATVMTDTKTVEPEPETMRPTQQYVEVEHPSDTQPTETKFSNVEPQIVKEVERPLDDGKTQVSFGGFNPNQNVISKVEPDIDSALKMQDYDFSQVTRPDDGGKTQVSFGNISKQNMDQRIESLSQNIADEMPTPQTQHADDDKTVVIDGMKKASQSIPTSTPTTNRQYHDRNNGPVVGWVVAVKGPHIGESFELYTKKNFIGRNKDVVVNLYLDNTVSRTSPLGIIFNERKNQFMVLVGASDQTVYINDDLLLENMEIVSGDIITIGNTVLLFVPLVTKEKEFGSIYMME